MFGKRRSGENDELVYAKDMRLLAEFLQVFKSNLPAHIFWLTSTPQNFIPYGTCAAESERYGCGPTLNNRHSRWRGEIAEPILKNHAPHVKIVYVDQPFVLRAKSHPSKGKLDCTHWCLQSRVWNDHVRYILTVILSHVNLSQEGNPVNPWAPSAHNA